METQFFNAGMLLGLAQNQKFQKAPVTEPVREKEPQLKFSLEFGADVTTAPYRFKENLPSQDAGIFLKNSGVVCACDGMGSGGASELAAEAAIRALEDQYKTPGTGAASFFSADLNATTWTVEVAVEEGRRLITTANQAVIAAQQSALARTRCEEAAKREQAQKQRWASAGQPIPPLSPDALEKRVKELVEHTQTTLTFAKVFQTPEGKAKALIGNVGDSRIYLRRQGVWTVVSRDHGIGQTLLEGQVIKDELNTRQIVHKDDVLALLQEQRILETLITNDPTDVTEDQRVAVTARINALETLLREYDRPKTPITSLTLGDVNSYVLNTLGGSDAPDLSHVYTIDVEEGDELYAFSDGIFENRSLARFEEIRQSIPNGDLMTFCQTLNTEIRGLEKSDPHAFKDDDLTSVGMRVSFSASQAS